MFAYRWDANVPGIGDTLVEFTLAPEGDGTRAARRRERVRLARAPAPTSRSALREGNVGGWEHELGDLERYAQTVTV